MTTPSTVLIICAAIFAVLAIYRICKTRKFKSRLETEATQNTNIKSSENWTLDEIMAREG